MKYEEAAESLRKGEKIYVKLVEDTWFQIPALGEHDEVQLKKGTMGILIETGSNRQGRYAKAIFNFGWSIADYIGPTEAECYPSDLAYLATI